MTRTDVVNNILKALELKTTKTQKEKDQFIQGYTVAMKDAGIISEEEVYSVYEEVIERM